MVAKGKGSISATYCTAKNLDMTHCDNGMPAAELDSVCPNSCERFLPFEKAGFVFCAFLQKLF